MEEMVFVSSLAGDLGMDKGNLFKLLKKLKIATTPIRSPKHGQQKIAALTKEDVSKVISYRTDFYREPERKIPVIYLVQLLPDLSPNRVKIGYTADILARIRDFKTTCPDLKLVKTWQCSRQTLEPGIVSMIITSDDKSISNEVYQLKNIEDTLRRAEEVFKLLEE